MGGTIWSYYYDNFKYSDRQAWANSVDPDQGRRCLPAI